MLERLGEVPFENCLGRYRLVRQLVAQATSDEKKQSLILQTLFRYRGRCDCTVDRNILRVPENLSAAEAEIGLILQG